MPSPASTPVALTGVSIIDGLLSGGRWIGNSFAWSTADNPYQLYSWIDPFGAAPAIASVFEQFSAVANLSFTYAGHFSDFTSSTADITITWSDSTIFDNALAAAIFPLSSFGDAFLSDVGFTRAEWAQPEGDIGLNFDQQAILLANPNLLFYVGLHEIGHALGLKHPHDGGTSNYPTFADLGISGLDWAPYTVMSYNSTYNGVYPSTLMPLDILVLQYLYGPNLATGAGDTVHQVTNDGRVRTIWDASGDDTLDASATTTSIILDLRDGGFTQVGATTLVAIALNTIIENGVSGSGDDQLIGNDAANVLNGGAGADSMTGGAGDDTYIVDSLSDSVIESPGEGSDAVQTAISYTLGANVENLTLTGAGNVNGTGNTLNNAITGNSGTNTLDGGAGADAMAGGAGSDTYIVDNLGDVITENPGEGNDAVQSAISYTLSGNVENLTLAGSANVSGTGNALANVITGNSGNNTLDGGSGADAMTGGAGDDVYVVDNAGDVTTESPGQGVDTVQSSVTRNLGANIENLTLTGGGAITGFGNVLDNAITGNAAANSLYGFDGNDTLDGGAGNDLMFGGLGDDTYFVDVAGDVTSEASTLGGTDTVISSVTRNLTANIENLVLTGTAALIGYGNVLDNAITGNAGDNLIYGFDGNDVLDGSGGDDTMWGAFGDDTYYVDSAGDITVEGQPTGGTDTVITSISRNMNANFENMILVGSATVAYGNILGNVITGNALANSLYGFDGNDTLDGGTGNDSMFGGNGDDSYYVDAAGDVTSEASALGGTDTVFSSVTRNLNANIENLTLTGSSDITGAGNVLDNTIIGNSGTNTLYGLAGDDRLDGGLGADVLQGGTEADTYVFSSALGGGNVDQINGFSVAEDTIELDAAIFTALSAGPIDPGAFNTGAAASEADDRIVYDAVTGALYYDPDGVGGAAQIQFATLTAGLALTSDHFIVGGGP